MNCEEMRWKWCLERGDLPLRCIAPGGNQEPESSMCCPSRTEAPIAPNPTSSPHSDIDARLMCSLRKTFGVNDYLIT